MSTWKMRDTRIEMQASELSVCTRASRCCCCWLVCSTAERGALNGLLLHTHFPVSPQPAHSFHPGLSPSTSIRGRVVAIPIPRVPFSDYFCVCVSPRLPSCTTSVSSPSIRSLWRREEAEEAASVVAEAERYRVTQRAETQRLRPLLQLLPLAVPV